VEPEAPAAEATLPEANVVEGEYSAEAVVPPKEQSSDDADALVLREATGGAPELIEVTAGEAATATGGEEATTQPEPALEVVVRSPEIQDAEPIRSAPMTEAAISSQGGVELLADDLVDPATVARHLEAVRQAEQWMKVSSRNS
jgi:hypothetical protein